MVYGNMWRTGYVDTVNLRSQMPAMKIHQPTSGLRDPPSLMDLHNGWRSGNKPRTRQGAKGISEKDPHHSYHKLLPLPGGCFELWFACNFVIFPRFFVLLCLQVVVFFLFVIFFQLVLFKCLPNPFRGGHDSFFYFYFHSSLPICLLCFCFFLLILGVVPFVSRFHKLYMSCLSYPVWWHGFALPTALTAYVAT